MAICRVCGEEILDCYLEKDGTGICDSCLRDMEAKIDEALDTHLDKSDLITRNRFRKEH